MPASPSVAPAPAKPRRDTRAAAERTFDEAMTLLAGVALAIDGHCADDTPGRARILADLIGPGADRLIAAQQMFLDCAVAR